MLKIRRPVGRLIFNMGIAIPSKTVFPGMGIPMLKIRRPVGRLIFNMGIPIPMGIPMLKIRRPVGRLIFNKGITIPSKTVFLIETAPWLTHSFVRVFVFLLCHL